MKQLSSSSEADNDADIKLLIEMPWHRAKQIIDDAIKDFWKKEML